MKPTPSVLVLGSSSGIGAACAELYAKNKSKVYLVSRTVGDLCGDLSDPNFRKSVVNLWQPQIVIATFGDWPSKNQSATSIFDLFTNSVIDLFEQFEKKGGIDYFVVVSSLSAVTTVHPFMSIEQFHYLCAKRILSDFFTQAQLYMKFKTKIILIEPGMILTDFADIRERMKSPKSDDFLMQARVAPMPADELAQRIFDATNSFEKRNQKITLYNQSTTN